MKKKFLYFTFLSFLTLGVIAQNDPKTNQKKEKAQKNLKKALEKLEAENAHDALELLIEADSLDKSSPEINYWLGALLVLTKHDHKALKPLEFASNSGFKIKELDYFLARAQHADNEPAKALALFESVKGNYKKDDFDKNHLMSYIYETFDHFKSELNHEIEYCKNGIELMKTPVDVSIKNMGDVLNSHYPEYVPAISADESVLIFTSCRPTTTGGKRDKDGQHNNHFYEDIYISHKNADDSWTTPVGVSNLINTSSHDACVGLSADGQKMFIYKDVKSSKLAGDLYYSELKGTTWTDPKAFNVEVNSDDYEPSCSMSSDGRLLFFTSNRPGGFGGLDIYVGILQANGEYKNVKNLGPSINTEYDEDGPFIHADGKTLYFSSKGHKSMGGFDIFKCTVNEKTGDILSQPVNLGYPLNTAEDDIFFVWSADGKRAYFSSERENGIGEKDLYLMEIKQDETHVIVLRGNVLNKKTKKPVAATITVIDLETKDFIGVFNSNSKTGKYTVVLPSGKNYSVTAETDDGYFFFSSNRNVPKLQKYAEIIDTIYLEPVKVGTTIPLHNIFFDLNKATLRPESEVELNKLNDILSKNPSLKICIVGHTDSDGEAPKNLILSEARSKSVVEYLVKKGIKPNRLTSKGLGESKPLVPNDTPANKQLNRRTEFEVLE